MNDGKDVNPDKISYEKPEWLVDEERRKMNRDRMIKEGIDLASLVHQCEKFDEWGQLTSGHLWYIDECLSEEEYQKWNDAKSQYAMGKMINDDMVEFNQYKEKVNNKIKSMVDGEINNIKSITIMVKNGQIINLQASGQVKQNNQIKTFDISNNEIIYK